jgi:hypothetical protein
VPAAIFFLTQGMVIFGIESLEFLVGVGGIFEFSFAFLEPDSIRFSSILLKLAW